MQDLIQEYIEQFPEEIQVHLNKVRQTILNTVKGLEEKMAYGLPAYHYNKKPFGYFGAFKHHLGFYATPSVHEHPEMEAELSKYKQGRGSVQFPYKSGIPYDLIVQMLLLRKRQMDID